MHRFHQLKLLGLVLLRRLLINVLAASTRMVRARVNAASYGLSFVHFLQVMFVRLGVNERQFTKHPRKNSLVILTNLLQSRTNDDSFFFLLPLANSKY